MTTPQNPTITAILTSAQLPTLPVVACKILELTAREDGSVAEVIELIAQDAALSAKLLRVANSALYRFPRQISSISRAVSLLGLNAVRGLVLGFTFLSMGRHQEVGLFRHDRFWQRSLTMATAARLLAARVPAMEIDEIFTSCLLCDIGQLIFALTLPSRSNQVLQRLHEHGDDTNRAAIEEQLLGTTHHAIGAEAARIWGLPPLMEATIRHHHQPTGWDGTDKTTATAITIAHLADLATAIFYSLAPLPAHQRFCEGAQTLLELEPREIEALLATLDLEVAMAAFSFDVALQPVRPVADIIQEANLRISQLHQDYQSKHRELVQANAKLEWLREQLEARGHQLESLANIDGLTGVSNHRCFQTFLQTEIVRTVANSGTLSLLLVDIDHFKRFNDTHGHRAGDFLLKDLCRVARMGIRTYDLLARYGGEEFAIVLPDTGPEGAKAVAERVLDLINGHDFIDNANHFRVTVSIGAASLNPTDVDRDRDRLIALADQALYQAKTQGRNRVCQYAAQTERPLPTGHS